MNKLEKEIATKAPRHEVFYIYVIIIISLLSITHIHSQELDIYGYFEPQYMGIYQKGNYSQLQSNKLRVDLKSTVVKNTEFGANFIYVLYFGRKDWNMLDFFPERITSTIHPSIHWLYMFTYKDSFFLDNAYIRLSNDWFALVVGKQQISLGTGYFSNPTDVFNVKNTLDPTYEQPGHNAIRIDLMLNHRLQLIALYCPVEANWKNSGKLLRMKVGIGHFDFSMSVNEMYYTTTSFFYPMSIVEQRRRLIGVDFVGELLGFGVWAEGAYSFLEYDDDFYEFIVGVDYTFESGLYTMLEYNHDSQAESNYKQYDLNDWMRYFSGETKTISRDQVYGFVQYPATDLLTIGGSIIVSASDKSAAIVPTVYYSIFENVDLTLMGNFYVGDEGKTFSSTLGNGGILRATVYF